MNGFTVSFAPLFGWPATALLGAAALVVAGLLLAWRPRAALLRIAAMALFLLALLDPSLRQENRQPLSDVAVAVVDHSLSMAAAGRGGAADQTLAGIKTQVAALPNTELRVVDVTSNLAAGETGTRAFAALSRAMADIPPDRFAGALVITDGQIHDAPPDAGKAGIAGPVHGIITGARSERDRKLVIDTAPRFGIVGKDQTIRFHVEDVNGDGAPVSLTVTTPKGEQIPMTVTAGEAVTYPVTVDHAGQNIVEIAASPLAGEVSLANNRAVVAIDGIRDRLRVLLVSGQPHPGERVWRSLLKSDTSVDLVHFTILRPPEKQDGTPIKELALIAFPTRELFVDKLSSFDLVIFDRYQRESVMPPEYLRNIAQYVQDGGAVLLASGPDYASEDGLYNTPLSDIIPVAPTGNVTNGAFRPKVTDLGLRHPVTRDLPGGGPNPTWGRWFRVVDTDPGRGTAVLSGTNEAPLLVLSREGKGRVAQMLSDQGWLWARGYDGGGPQTELLRRIAHWLMKEPDLEEEQLSGHQQGEQLVIERNTMADKASAVAVTMPSGKSATVDLSQTSPGRFVGKLAVTEPGLYRLTDGKFSAVAAIGSPDAREAQDLVATDQVLLPVAKAVGGGIAWTADGLPRLVKVAPGGSAAGNGWLGLRANGAYRVTSISSLPLSSTLASLAVLLMLLAGMWYREGR